jgi:alkanesulfonate monooxygenase SsuD/methylene tetrahydromethanopterin reductase-like flavin-dependent oxidoreductase (luciferase family)
MMGIPFARSNTLADVKAKNDLYLESYAKAGHKASPEIMVAMHIYLDRDERAAVDGARPCFERAISFHKTHRRPGSKIPQFDNIQQEQLALFTTPGEAVAILREYEKIGVTHVIGMVNFGGVPMGDVRRTLELMSKEVFPSFA